MTNATKRSILRTVHLIFSIPILGYIYSPFEEIPKYAFVARFVFVPIVFVAGFWMWMATTAKKSMLIPLGTGLILIGIVAPLPLTTVEQSTPPGTSHSVVFVAIQVCRVCFFAGLVFVIIGALRNRKLKLVSPESTI